MATLRAVSDAVSTTTAAPSAEQGTEYRLDPQLPRIWALVALVPVLPVATAGIVTVSVFGLFWLVPAVLALALLVPWLVRGYGRRYVATFRCVLGAPGLYVERGVWWRSLTFVPRARVQHTDVDQGPLARRFGLATLKVFTAGSEHSEIQIEELRHADALRLRDDLLERHERSA